MGLKRRDFLKIAIFTPLALRLEAKDYIHRKDNGLKEASYYIQYDRKKNLVMCNLCPRECIIEEGEKGFCRARKNIKGKLYPLGYAKPCAVHIDPIEKKPFFHVLPKTLSFSIASAGCNLRCRYYQNWQISQVSP
ncbi:MAG TPA: hypothetical protein PLM71_11825, partial [Syntrophorhabdaceae bacterium]|nr:hypothetical protein [Syntrophorhabdaceae bacterium]